MSDTVVIVLIVVVAIIVILFLFRKQMSRFFIKANKEGLEAQLETHRENQSHTKPKSVRITETSQNGEGHVIDVSRDDVEIDKVKQTGKKHKLTARPEIDLDKKK